MIHKVNSKVDSLMFVDVIQLTVLVSTHDVMGFSPGATLEQLEIKLGVINVLLKVVVERKCTLWF